MEAKIPVTGMETIRRKELVDAALRTIGQQGSLSVTMSEIAREAGVSPALAHHYFGNKEQLLEETMRSLLRQLHSDTARALAAAASPRERLSAIVRVSFQADQFDPGTIAAWLAFYANAQRSENTRRLLLIYTGRLASNLRESLLRLCPRQDAARIAAGAGAMIDGLYIRHSLRGPTPDASAAMALVEDYLTTQLQPFTVT